MTATAWALALGVNVAIAAAGWLRSKRPRDATGWQLAARRLAWPAVGLSLFATAIDSGDFVAVVGGAYTYGISYLTTWWLGLPIGWLLLTSAVLVPVYRSGFFTNAEYLEARFSPGVRLLGALVQIQQRTHVMGNMAYSLFLLLGLLTGWGGAAWWLVVGLAALAAWYTASGGLRTVVATDSLQALAIVAGAGLLWILSWRGAGGWDGIQQRLGDLDPDLPRQVLAYSGLAGPGAPLALVLFGWITVHVAYSIVNHSQAMRLLGCRSARDMRGAAAVASAVLILVTWCTVTMGIAARAIYPGLERVDDAFPRLFADHASGFVAGLVLAGVLAACMSTYDSIGSALGAVFTRDVFGRFLVPGAGERASLSTTRAASALCIAVSFAYVPFLDQGMVSFYLRLSSVAVVPLATVFAIGALTRASKGSGMAGLLAGMCFGLLSMLGDRLGWPLPLEITSVWWGYFWAVAVTAAVMAGHTAFVGPASRESLAGLTLGSCRRGGTFRGTGSGWQERTRAAVAAATQTATGIRGRWDPQWTTVVLVTVTGIVYFLSFD